jgi:hypothetical protein
MSLGGNRVSGVVSHSIMNIPWLTVLKLLGASDVNQFKTGICLLVILCLIWFGDQMGSFTGYIGRGGNIDVETPGWLVCAMGWFLLIGIPVLLTVLNRG